MAELRKTKNKQGRFVDQEYLANADLNTLPYSIIEAQTNRLVTIHFETLTPQDVSELRNEDWTNAVFRDVWPQLTLVENTFKMVRTNAPDTRIQGVVRVGSVLWAGGLLEGSLLEAAPFNLHGYSAQTYRGVGRALVARLVAESILQGGQGRVGVLPRRGSEAFYYKLGFRQSKVFRLGTTEAQALLQSTLFPLIEAEEDG